MSFTLGTNLNINPDNTPAEAEMREPLDPANIWRPRKYVRAFPENPIPRNVGARVEVGTSRKKLVNSENIIGMGPEGRKLTVTPVYASTERMMPISIMLDKIKVLMR